MASLKKRGNNYYAQYYVNGRQKRVNLNTASLQIAKERLRQIESALFREDDIPLPTKTPLCDILEMYIAHLRGRVSEKNLQKVKTYLRSTFGQVCDNLKIRNQAIAKKAVKRPASGPSPIIEIIHIEQLTPQMVSEFLSSIVMMKAVKPRTVNHYRQNLVALCNWARREGGVRFPGDRNPAGEVKCYKVPKRAISFLRLHEIQDQLDSFKTNVLLQAMIAVYIYAGLRREEALWLTHDDIEWSWGEYGAIWVRAKNIDGECWEPKTGEDRIVPINSKLRKYLDQYLTLPKRSDTWFFPSPRRGRWDADNFSEWLREENAKVGLKWSCLDYRHTFGSQIAMKGESLYKISQLMGNSPEICRKHYAALLPESLAASTEFPTDPVKELPEGSGRKTLHQRGKGPMLKLVVNNGR